MDGGILVRYQGFQRYQSNLSLKFRDEIIHNDEDKFETVLFLPEGEESKGEGRFRTKGHLKKSYKNIY